MNAPVLTWLLDTLLVTGGLIALVLVIRRPVARWFGPGMAYALWALPLLRLMLPPLVLPATPVAAVAADGAVAEVMLTAAPAAAPLWPDLLLALWLGGAGLFLLWRAACYIRMRRALLADAQPLEQIGAVRLVESPATQSPVAFGVLDKVVALPAGFMDRADRAGRDLAITHELQHHAGRDLAVNLAMQPLLALHWFNPLAWAGWRALRRDQEAACDARVLAGADGATRAAYAHLIATFAKSPRLALAAPMACPVLGEKSVIHRLRSLTMHEPTPRRRLAGTTLIAVGALALPLTASISYSAAEAAPSAPEAPPALPAPPAPELHKQHRIVIVEKQADGENADAALKTRVVTRDGKTIVLKTSKDLTDAEVEEKVARAMAAMPPVSPVPPVPPVPPVDGQTRVIVKRLHGEGAPGAMVWHEQDGKPLAFDCPEGSGSTAESTGVGPDGKQRKMVMRFCAKGAPMAKAVEGIKAARDRLMKDDKLSPAMRDDIVRQLDAEIERLSKQG